VSHSSLFAKIVFDRAAEIAIIAIDVGWLCFAVIAIMGKRNQATGHARLDVKSRLGFFLQILACLVCLLLPRTLFSPFLPMSKLSEEILTALIAALTTVSVWFCYAAARTLGKQWALDARLIEGHELIRAGPFAIVRNPIYLAMLGMTVATYLAVSRWQALPFVLGFFALGTWIRIHTEENLLRENFGTPFADYVRRVPAFFPRLPH
jgi:protein-S-isoprenylcysteine O-methyltransferase Ste14